MSAAYRPQTAYYIFQDEHPRDRTVYDLSNAKTTERIGKQTLKYKPDINSENRSLDVSITVSVRKISVNISVENLFLMVYGMLWQFDSDW